MDTKSLTSPFATHDFFGYLIPGLLFVAGLYFHDTMILDGDGPVHNLVEAVAVRGQDGAASATTKPADQGTSPQEILGFTAVAFSLVASCYILGHLVSALGSALLDRAVIDRVTHYPYVRLLGHLFTIHPIEVQKRRYFTVILFLILISIVDIAVQGPSHALWVPVGILLMVVLGRITMRRSEEERESGVRHLARPFRMVIDAMVTFGNAIIRLMFGWIYTLLRLGGRLPNGFAEMFNKKFQAVYGREPNNLGTNVFWLSATYVMSRHPTHYAMAQRAYNMYTLMRNVCMVCLLLFGYGVVLHWTRNPAGGTQVAQNAWNKDYLLWVSATGCAAVLLWLRYYNTYYNHFTKLILRSFVTPDAQPEGSGLSGGGLRTTDSPDTPPAAHPTAPAGSSEASPG